MKAFQMSLSWQCQTICLWPRVSGLIKREEKNPSENQHLSFCLLNSVTSHSRSLASKPSWAVSHVTVDQNKFSVPELQGLVILSQNYETDKLIYRKVDENYVYYCGILMYKYLYTDMFIHCIWLNINFTCFNVLCHFLCFKTYCKLRVDNLGKMILLMASEDMNSL